MGSKNRQAKITEALKGNYLFASLHSEAIQLAVDAMAPKDAPEGFYFETGCIG